MAKQKKEAITVQGTQINIAQINQEDYISLTDMIKAKNGDFFISDWLRNRNTVEFLGIWESIHNPDFNYGGFAIIRSKAGLNNYKISAKEWVEQTNAIGIFAKAGRYGGTYAHKDIAFEFGMWISPEFKVYLIREFDRLKSEEQHRLSAEWSLQRTLAKINYKIHTDAIKEQIIPPEITNTQAAVVYANEADMLNVALFGKTASEWRTEHPDAAKTGMNIRDEATLEQLIVLSNLESVNAVLIRDELEQGERLARLNQIAISQLTSLFGNKYIKKLSAGF